MITMTLVAIVFDDVKLGFLFSVSILGWSKLFDQLISDQNASKMSKHLKRFLGRK
jgi:hypothetical protein